MNKILSGLDSAVKTLSITSNQKPQIVKKQDPQLVKPKDSAPNHSAVATTNNKTNLPKPSKLKSGRAVVSQGVTKKVFVCLYCGEAHNSTNCPSHTTLQARKDRLGQLNRCKRCVSLKHKTEDCTAELTTCKVCQSGTHHSALCCKVAVKSGKPPDDRLQLLLAIRLQVRSLPNLRRLNIAVWHCLLPPCASLTTRGSGL